MENVYQKITKLIKENKLEDALAMLSSIDNSEEVILLKSQYDSLKKSEVRGVISRDDFNTDTNKIKLKILFLAKRATKKSDGKQKTSNQEELIRQGSKRKGNWRFVAAILLLLPFIFFSISKLISIDNFDGTRNYKELGKRSKIKENLPLTGTIDAKETFTYAWLFRPDTLLTTTGFEPEPNEVLYFRYNNFYNDSKIDSVRVNNTPIKVDTLNHFMLYAIEEKIKDFDFDFDNLYSNEPIDLKAGAELYVVYPNHSKEVRITKGKTAKLRTDYHKYSNYFDYGTKCFSQGVPIFDAKTNKVIGIDFACSASDYSSGLKIQEILSNIGTPDISVNSANPKTQDETEISTFEFLDNKILLNQEVPCLLFSRNETNTNYVISDLNNKQLISVEINSVDGNTQTILKTDFTLRKKEIVIDRDFSIYDFVGELLEFEVINIDCKINNTNFKKMIKKLDS